MMSEGICYLVGAGPGDLGLVTLRAKECVEEADVVIYDALSSAEILRWMKPGAEKVYVGKRAKDHAMRQEDINALIVDRAAALDVGVTMRQSNHEGELIDWLYEAEDEGVEGVILNAAGFTHTSVALRDAIAAVNVPVIEVHLTNTAKREDFRQRSLIAPVCTGTISGFGVKSYLLALEAASRFEER